MSDHRIRLDGEEVSYSYRAAETPLDVVRNRITVTGSLFATAIGLSVLLGRRRA